MKLTVDPLLPVAPTTRDDPATPLFVHDQFFDRMLRRVNELFRDQAQALIELAVDGGGGGAPTDATYVTLSTDGTLTNERVLTAGAGISVTDGGAGGAVTIAASAGTAVNGMSKIAEVICVGGETTITFSSIPQTFTDLMLVLTGTDTASGSTNLNARLKINGDATAGNYTAQEFHEEFGSTNNGGTNAASAAGSCIGVIPGTSANANAKGSITVTLSDYTNTTGQKPVRAEYGAYYGNAAVPLVSGNCFWMWKSTAAISNLVLTPGGTAFAAGTRAVLYGLGGSTGGSASSVFTPGSVIFAGASGALTEDNPNLFFDDTNNRLGLGTNAPSVDFHVKKTVAAGGVLAYTENFSTSGYAGQKLFINGVEAAVMSATGSAFTPSGIFGASSAFFYGSQTGGTFVGNALAGPLVFFTGGTTAANERARIDSTGKVGIGTTPSQVLHVKTATGAATEILDAVDTTSTAGISFRSNNTSELNITGTGTGWTPTFTAGAAAQGVVDALGAGGALIMASNAAGVIKLATGGNGSGNVRVTIDQNGMFTLDGGPLKLNTVGQGLQVKEGTNATQGLATLVAGTVTVNTNKVTTISRIFLTAQNTGGTPGALRVSSRVAGTSFTITSTSGADTSSVAWTIIEAL